MADIGAISELVNAQNLKLQLGSDRYIMLQELELHLGRPEAREPTTDGGVQYFYGKGDHYFDATLLLTTPEIASFNALTELNDNGNMTENTYNIISTPRTGSPVSTVTVNAVVPDFNVVKPVEGGTIFRLRFRITDDKVTVS